MKFIKILNVFSKRITIRYIKFRFWRKLKHLHLNRPSKKGLVRAGLIISIVLISQFGLFKYFSPGMVSAWFDDNYLNRQKFSFTHNASISSERAVTFSLDTAELISAGVMQADCDDTRFTDLNGRKLRYELTGTCNNSATTYEVVFTSILNGTNYAYVYYGNPSAVSESYSVSDISALTPSGGDPSLTTRTNEEKSPGPVVYLKMDEGVDNTCTDETSDVCDSTPNLNNAIRVGAKWQSFDLCVSGNCLFFDGADDSITINDSGTIDFDLGVNDSFTYQAWIRVNSDGENSNGEIFDKGSHFYVRVDSEGVDGMADLQTGLDLDTTDPVVNIADGITLNRWHHIAVTYTDDSDDDLSVYIDGVLKDSGDGSGAPVGSDTNPLLIGGDSSNNFHGFIDEVKINNYEKTALQINNEFRVLGAGSAVSAFVGKNSKSLSDGLNGYWNLNPVDTSILPPGPELIDDAGDPGIQDNSARQLIRSSSGTAYAAIHDSGYCEIWKSTDGSNWSEMDSADKPVCIRAPDISVDSNDVIHMVYQETSNNLRYVKFTTSNDQFSSLELIQNTGLNVIYITNIAIDTNNVPHILWSAENESIGGGALYYINKIGGTWNSIVSIVTGDTYIMGSILINEDNVPEILYTTNYLIGGVGNVNNATSFTLQNIDTSITDSGVSIGLDTSGNTWVSYVDENGSDDYITLIKHNDSDSWSTWQAPVNNLNIGTNPSIAVDGSSVYIFYQTGSGIAYDKYANSTWQEETLIQSGTLYNPKARWSNYNNLPYNNYGYEYLYSDGTDIYWAALDPNPPTNLLDFSGNNNSLTNHNSIEFTNGKYGTASEHIPSSAQYLSPAVAINNVRSLSFWVNPDSTTNYFISLTPTAYITSDASSLTATGFNNPKIYINGVETSVITADIWQHIVVTSDTEIDASEFYIGKQAGNYFDGTMDEIRLYNRTFTQTDIQTLYNWQPSPVAHWKLDDDSDSIAFDSSSRSNNLIKSAGIKSMPGKYGSGVDLENKPSGTQYLRIHDSSQNEMDISGSMTISAWVNLESTDGTIQAVAGKDALAPNRGIYLGVSASDKPMLLVSGNGTGTTTITGDTTLATNSWHYLTGVYDGTNLYVYLDGKKDTTEAPYNSGIFANSSAVCVGGRGANCSDDRLDGKIDEVKVFNYARTSSQIVEDFNAGHPAPGSPIGSSVAYWKFDENSLSACTDGTGSYPTVADKGTQYNTISTPATTHNIDMPSNINTGDLLLIIASSNDPGTLTGISGWTSLLNNDVPNLGAYVAYKKADGTEGANATVSTTNSVNMVARIWRITRWHGTTAPEINYSLENDRNTTNINPPSLTPSWGLANTLWIAEGSWLNNPLNTYPTSYGDNQETAITNGTFDIAYAAATREYSATSENPGAFIISSSSQAHLELTIAVRPGYNYICDSSANLNHLTYTNSYGGFIRSGKFGSAYDGADNNRAVRDDDSDFDFSNGSDEFTLSGWVKRSAISNQEYILDKHETNDGYTLYMDSDGDFVFGIGDGAASFPEESIGGSLSRNYDDDIWHHVTAVKKSTEYIKLYVDGREIASDTSLSVTGDMSNSGKLILGDDDETDGTDEFLGDIDDVKIFRSALSENQIKLLYNQSSSAVWGASSTDASGIASFASDRSYCPPGDTAASCAPVGEWKLDENTNTTRVSDTSTNSKPGNLINIDSNNWVPGKVGSGLKLNGIDEYIDIGTGPTTVRTISFWVKPVTTTEYFINLTSNTDYISASSGTIGMTGDASETIYVNGVATTTITANIWQHVIVVTSANENASNLDIGRTTDTNYLEGVIDDVKIYDYALSPSQVAWNYSKGEPIVRYKFDECLGNVAYDSGYKADPSSTRHDGTITPSSSGNTTAGTCGSGTSTEMWNDGTNGKMNGSMGFDGTDDYVVTTTDSRLQGNNSFSVTAWVKPNSFGSANAVVALFGSSTDKGYWLNVGSDGSVTLWISTNGSAQSAPPTYAGTISTGQWSHLVGTFDGSAIKIYVNGRLISSGSVSGPVHTVSTSNAFTIGRLGATSADYFNGLIDDVRIYKYALSSQQVLTVMNDGALKFAPLTGSPQ